MMAKRQATTDLNHSNWDKDDPADHEEMGTYKVADRDILEKRVFRTAKRRNPISAGDEAKKSVFSSFGGFNKTQPSSFDFLANLTNGNKTNGSATSNNETPVSSAMFQNKSMGDVKSSSGLFSIPVSTSAAAIGSTSSQSKPLFGIAASTNTSSLFSATNTNVNTNLGSSPNNTSENSNLPSAGFSFKTSTSPVVTTQTTSAFGSPNTTSNKTSITSSNTTLFKIQPISSDSLATSNKVDKEPSVNSADSKNDKESKKLAYYAKLKGLNESVSDWIKKHVEETPLCILTPIFTDYENHLKVIQEEYHSDSECKKDDAKVSTALSKDSIIAVNSSTPIKSPSCTLYSGSISNSSSSLFAPVTTQNVTPVSSPFSFGISTTPKSSTVSTGGFSIEANKTLSPVDNKQANSPFTFANNTTTTNSTAPAPFSFGLGQKFSFSPKTVQSSEASEEKPENEEDEPPKVEYTPVVEENCVFEKRCKVFVKKDENFVDKGVGTLYIKKIEDSGKHQMIVRANTNLGTLLVNMILASAIPTKRMGKNNVMLVCIPTPDAKPPPVPILIRVKTSEEADELLETLDKHKA